MYLFICSIATKQLDTFWQMRFIRYLHNSKNNHINKHFIILNNVVGVVLLYWFQVSRFIKMLRPSVSMVQSFNTDHFIDIYFYKHWSFSILVLHRLQALRKHDTDKFNSCHSLRIKLNWLYNGRINKTQFFNIKKKYLTQSNTMSLGSNEIVWWVVLNLNIICISHYN